MDDLTREYERLRDDHACFSVTYGLRHEITATARAALDAFVHGLIEHHSTPDSSTSHKGGIVTEKLKMYRITLDTGLDGDSYTVPTMDAITAELESAQVGDEYTVAVVEMTQAEYDALPEFEGF